MSWSDQAARFGALAERVARERYGLDSDHSDHSGIRVDAIGPDGRPWDIKAAMASRESPRFRLWEDQHNYLLDNSGGYVFVFYRPSGRGIQVLRIRSIRAADLDLSFYGAGGHRDQRQVKVNPRAIF